MTPDGTTEAATPRRTLVDLAAVDLDATFAGDREIERFNPHRGLMRFLDRVVWVAEDHAAAVGLHDVPADPFWAPGHFPSRPTMPGVLMVEAGAQLACFLWNFRQGVPRIAAFLRIEDTVFRRAVVPGECLVLLCQEVKYSRRRFISALQGVVGGTIAFEARISGIAMEEHRGNNDAGDPRSRRSPGP